MRLGDFGGEEHILIFEMFLMAFFLKKICGKKLVYEAETTTVLVFGEHVAALGDSSQKAVFHPQLLPRLKHSYIRLE